MGASNDGLELSDLRVEVATLRSEMNVALEGVANFRSHTKEMATFCDYVKGEFRDMKSRDEERVKTQKAIAEALAQREHEEIKRTQAREQKADRWWKRIAVILAIMGSLATISNITGPTVRHFLHTHGFSFIEETSTDAPHPQSSIPENATQPYHLQQ